MEVFMIFVVATSVLKPGCRNAFIAAVKDNLAKVRAEAGCISYNLTGDFNSGFPVQEFCGEDTLVFVECWESIEHLKAHLAAPHMAEFKEKVKDLRISSTLKVLTECE